jgi:hypothetical protein
MATSGRGSGMVGCNVQTAVDIKHHLILSYDATNVDHDRTQLANIAKLAGGSEQLKVVADQGYFKGEQILECEQVGITTYPPKPQTSNNLFKVLFSTARLYLQTLRSRISMSSGRAFGFSNEQDRQRSNHTPILDLGL